MQRTMLKSKIHRVTVTGTNLEYEGSIAIDPRLMKAANIYKYEQVHIFNINNGNRFITYCVNTEKSNNEIILNGAAARLASAGDKIIIISYGNYECTPMHLGDEYLKPTIVLVNGKNKIKEIK